MQPLDNVARIEYTYRKLHTKRFTLTLEVEINAENEDEAMQLVYNGIRNQSDDATVNFRDSEETPFCIDGCGEVVEIEGSRCYDCQHCGCDGAKHDTHGAF